MIDNYGSDWLITASVDELEHKIALFEKIFGKPQKFNIIKENYNKIISKKGQFYDIIIGDIFLQSQKINGNVAIVNPANKEGLGCFNPSHQCIDNQLHRYEGPQLRLLLSKLPNHNNERLKIAEPIVTPTFRLKINHVIHVVAPDCSRKTSSDEDYVNLIKCYDNSIKLAESLNLDYILFPTIGTGVFGFDKKITSLYVHNYLKNTFNNRKIRVVLCLIHKNDIEMFNNF